MPLKPLPGETGALNLACASSDSSDSAGLARSTRRPKRLDQTCGRTDARFELDNSRLGMQLLDDLDWRQAVSERTSVA